MKRHNVRSAITGNTMRVIGVQKKTGRLHCKIGSVFGGFTVLVAPSQVVRQQGRAEA